MVLAIVNLGGECDVAIFYPLTSEWWIHHLPTYYLTLSLLSIIMELYHAHPGSKFEFITHLPANVSRLRLI